MIRQHKTRSARAIRRGFVAAARSVADLGLSELPKGPTALVVDDEPLVRHFVSAILRREGWSVLEAADTVAALAVAHSEQLDLLVTDFEMPVVGGLALAEQLRALDGDLPVLVVSGRPEARQSTAGLRGRTAFASKPFQIDELVSTIGSIVD